MSKKITIAILSILTIFFLTAQTCSLPTTSTGLAADCVGEGDVVCDDTEAYECGLAAYGTGYYVSRASEFDAEYCGAVEAFDEEALGRRLITLSSDLENIIDDLNDLKMQGRNAEADGDGRALVMIRAELSDIRTSLAEISTVLDTVVADVAAAAADGEDTSALDALVTDAQTELTVAEDLLLLVSTQVTDALAALSGSGTSALVVADCSVSSTTAAVGETITFDGSRSHSAASYSWDFDGDGSEDSTSASDTYTYSAAGTYTATLTVTASDGTTDTGTCDSVTVSEATTCTDEGDDIYTKQTATASDGTVYEDVCMSTTSLLERECESDGSVAVTGYSCTDYGAACSDGACVVEEGGACSSDEECSSGACYNAVCVHEKPFTASEITGIEMESGSLPLSSELSIRYYDDVNARLATGAMGEIAIDGTYTQNTAYEPSSAKPIMVVISTVDWNEIDGWPYGAIESDNEAEPSAFWFFMKRVMNTDVDETLPGYIAFYIGESGATYYASETHDFVLGTEIMTPEEALREEHIAQENPW